MTSTKNKTKKYLKLLGKFLLGLVLIFVIIILLIRTPWAQNRIVHQITDYVSNKTNTKASIERAFITFSGDIELQNLFLEDQKGDTLIFSKSLRADIPIRPIIFGNKLSIDNLISNGLTANITRKENTEDFNFSFLINAFSSANDSSKKTEPLEIFLGKIELTDWNLRYNDAYLGTTVVLDLDKLSLNISEFDLETMRYSITNFTVENTIIDYLQTHPFPISNDTTPTKLPFIEISDFNVNDVRASYKSVPDRNNFDFNLGVIKLTDVVADVRKNHYETNKLNLKNSQISIKTKESSVGQKQVSKPSPFAWPEFILAAKKLELSNNSVNYALNDTSFKPETFDVNAFKISRLNLSASDFNYKKEKFNLKVSEFSFWEPSGIHLDQLAFNAAVTDKEASLSNVALQLNQSSANATLNIKFSSLDAALKNPEESTLSASLNNLLLEIEDVQKLLPELAQNKYLDSLSLHPILGALKAEGSLKRIDNLNANLAWGSTTTLVVSGAISNLTEQDSLQYNLNNIVINSEQNDINKFISSKDLGISIPKRLHVLGTINGGTTWANTDMKIKIPEGLAQLNAKLDFKNTMQFNGAVTVDSLQIGKLLQNDQLGTITFNVTGKGSGTAISNSNAEVKGSISQFQFNGYNYKNIEIDGTIKDGNGNVTAGINDPNLNMNFNSSLDLTKELNNTTFSSNIIGADLQELRLTKDKIKIAANVNGKYSGIPSNFSIDTNIENGIAIANNEQYQVSTIYLKAHIEDSITDVSIESGFINGELSSNASPNRIITALKKQLEHYFTPNTSTYEAEDDIKAKLALAVIPTPLLSKVFLSSLEELDSLNIEASFDSKKQDILAQSKIPHVIYAGSSVDSLNAFIKGDSIDLNFSIGFADLLYDPIHLKQTYLKGSLKNKELLLDFNSKNDTVQVVHIASGLVLKKDTLKLRVNPENLVLNKKLWELPDDNSILIAPDFTDFQNLLLSRNEQKLEITNKVPNTETEHIGILFQDFPLQTFLSLFNPDEALAKGKIEGEFIILNPYAASGLVADIKIKDFQVLQNPLGTLSLDASSKSLYEYDFDLALKNGGADLKLIGDYTARKQTADLNLELDIQKLEASVIQSFSKEQLSNAKGYLTGSMLVNGTLAEPKYSGRLNFNAFEISLANYKTTLQIDKQSVDLDQYAITFNGFTFKDANDGALTLDGKIITENLLNPRFDFNIRTEKFRILDSKKGDSELVYGIASVKANVKVNGDLETPVIKGKIRVRDITDLTYVVPQDQLDIQERDGVVVFVNRENPDAILTRNDREVSNSFFKGMDIRTTLEVGNEASFTIVLDEKTKDKLKASGDATLNLSIEPNQDIRLSGRLELNSGFYRTSLYNLVSREFQLQKGSSIVWSGDPYDAKMDVTAIYEIETSAAPLMSTISYGKDSNVSGIYQQSVPFLVYLNIDGQILQPELSFALDMPKKVQGNFGGAVYGRIQQLNEQESELNKQVFSLLALNRFYPTTGSDGSNGGAIALAKNNVNKVLSGELNSISDKLLGDSGFELGFDLDSYEDYQTGTAQSRTQLNINARKKLFDDRLIVTAGSALDVEGSDPTKQSAAPIIGNVTLEYLLSEDGIYRLKGFRRQEYQNVIDGQLIVTGVAFIFNREFNKFSQLFSPLKKGTKKVKSSKEKVDTQNKN